MGRSKEPKAVKKVAIVGFAGTKDMAPYNDPECEIWSVNNLYKFIPRTDRIFQLHLLESLKKDHHGIPAEEHMEFLRSTQIPVYMQDHYEEIPASVRFPVEKLIEEFGILRADDMRTKDAYFTNSISFMIALAIYEGFTDIGIYGVDMAVAIEYHEQRPSCEYYIGIAKGRGINIHMPAECDLLKSRFVYGYEEEKKTAWQMKLEKTVQEMQQRKMQADKLIRDQQSVSDKYEGAISMAMEMRTWD